MRKISFMIALMTCCCLWIACSKKDADALKEFPKVKIDSLHLLEFDDISIAASYENAGADPILKKGFCWSTSQNPDINDHKSDIIPSALFSDTVYDAGWNITIYLRAYVQTTDSIYYSNNASIVTEGLDNSFKTDLNDGRIRRIRQVIETADNNFLQLIQVVTGAISWPQVVKLDRTGNVIWKQNYYAGQNKHPDEIIQVTDGYLFVSTSFVNPLRGISLTKIDFNGVKAWEKNFTQKINQELIRISVQPNNTTILTMFSYDSFIANGRTNCTIDECIVDMSGNVVSEKKVPVDNQTTLRTYAWLGSNAAGQDFLISGHYTDGNLIFDELAIQKFNSSNQIDWEKRYKSGKVKGPADIDLTIAGDYGILALIEQSGKESTWIFEIDKVNGNKKWEFTYNTDKYGSSISTFGNKLYLDASGNYYIFGRITDPLPLRTHLFVLKLSANGKRLWSYVFKYPKGQSAYPDDILKIGNDIYLFGTILDEQVVGSNSIFMMKLTEN